MPRQAGVLLPLFSIRSAADWGIGEIPDLVPWARWCAAAGFSAAQVLPVNEASRGQNSPYAALSAFAVDPVYVGVGALEDFEAAGGISVLSRQDAALLEAVRSSPGVRWNDVRGLKRRALELAFRRFEREEWARRLRARTSSQRTVGDARTASSSAASSRERAETPPAASKSSSAPTPTYTGSTANAERAAYGLFWPREASFTGSTCATENPAAAHQRAHGTRSGISPTPQSAEERTEKSGRRTPACRGMGTRVCGFGRALKFWA